MCPHGVVTGSKSNLEKKSEFAVKSVHKKLLNNLCFIIGIPRQFPYCSRNHLYLLPLISYHIFRK